MFTGMVQEVGRVVRIHARSDGARVEVAAPRTAPLLGIGDSIATHGACLTCVARTEESFEAGLSRETLDRTTLGELRPGRRGSLEPDVRLSGRLAGDQVAGTGD